MRRLLAILVLLMPLDVAAQLNSNSFSPVTWYGAGANDTYSVAAGDLNNDGFADIVVSQQYQSGVDHRTTVSVFMNNGSGAFALSARYTTDGFIANPWASVAIADMDGDGKADLVVLNSAAPSPSVSVMRGNGDGTFQAAVSYLLSIYPNTSVTPSKLAVADVNLDGKPDVLVADGVAYAPNAFPNNFRGGVSVLLNQGTGTLASPILYDSGGYVGVGSVISADVNRDGFPDILVSNFCSTLAIGGRPSEPCRNGDGSYVQGTVGVLLGNGNGTFQQAVSYPSGGVAPLALVATDLNHDGKLDLLVTNGTCFQCSDNSVEVLLGIGDGSFQPPVSYLATFNFGAPQPVVWVAARDVDGDGNDDAVVLSGGSGSCGCTGTLSVLLGNGNGTLQAPAVYNWSSQPGTSFGDSPNTVVVNEVNNDGKPDVVVIGWTSIGVLLNQTPRAATTTTLFSQPNPSGYGQDVTFTATVSSSTPGIPSGTVTFTDGATTLGTAPLVNSVATLNTSSLSLGSHSVVASYSSDSLFRASVSPALTQVVKAATTTTLVSSANPSADQQSVTFTATVTPQFGGALNGSVTFKDGSAVLDIVALTGNTAAYTTSSLATGAHSITAVYSGDINSLGSTSAPLNQTVAPTTQVTVTTLPSGLAIVVDSVTYTAPQTFQWIIGSSHTIEAPTPQAGAPGIRYVFATWSDGGAASHSVTAPAAATTYTANFITQYQLITAASPSGNGTVSPGSGFFDAGQIVPVIATPAAGYQFSNWTGPVASSASAATSVTMTGPATVTANFVNASTSIVLTSSSNPSVLGQPVTLTATVSPSAAPGKVTFYDGVNVLGVATITNGQATLSTSLLPAGNRSLKAFYQGSGSYNSSVSPVVSQTVNTAPQNGFAAPVIYSGFQTLFAAVAADFNRDGRTDVAVTNVGARTVDVLLGTGTGSFQPAIASVAGVTPYFAAAADFNEDGIPDLVVGGATTSPGSSVNILLGVGDGSFQNPIANPTSGDGYPNVLVVGDFNGDGHSDVAVSLRTAGSIGILLGNGNGTFQPAVNYSGSVGDSPIGITAGDFNGDGNPDLAVAVTTIAGPFSFPAVVKILLGTGSGGFQAGASYTVGLEWSIVSAADFDGDGRVDLAVSSYESNSVSVLLSNGDGTFRGPFAYAAGLIRPLYSAIGDFNGDGRADVAVSSDLSNTLSVLFGNGDGTLQAAVGYPIGAANAFVFAVGEFNGDGRSDVAIPMGGVGSSGELRVLFGAPPTSAITVDTVPPGLAITVDNVNYTAPQTFQWTIGSNHTIATATPQAGPSGTRYVFSNWSDSGALSHSVTTPSNATTYSANFKTQYQLTLLRVPTAGGSVSPASGTFYDAGQVVSVLATPAAGYAFGSWSGPVASPTSANTTVTMNGPVNLTANFTSAVQLTVTVSIGRLVGNNYIVTLSIRNVGTAIAQNVQVLSIQMNNLFLPLGQLVVGNVAPGAVVPYSSLPFSGTPGSSVVFRYSGTYLGGTFSGAVRLNLP